MPPNWEPGLQPRHRPWLGIEPVTLWFTGRHSIHWATSGMYTVKNLIYLFNIFINIYMLVPIIYMYNIYTYICIIYMYHINTYTNTHIQSFIFTFPGYYETFIWIPYLFPVIRTKPSPHVVEPPLFETTGLDSYKWSLKRSADKVHRNCGFAMYNVHFFAQIVEWKIRMHIMCG